MGGAAGAGGAPCGATAFCAPRADVLLCDDFETGEPSKAWDLNQTVNPDMQLEVIGAGSCYALRAAANATSAAGARHAMLTKTFVGAPRFYCEADLFIEGYTEHDVALITFDFSVPGFQEYLVSFVLHKDASENTFQAGLETYKAPDSGGDTLLNTKPVNFPPRNVRVRLEASPDLGARVFYDAASQDAMPQAVDDVNEIANAASLRLQFGISHIEGGEGMAFVYDNVACGALPDPG